MRSTLRFLHFLGLALFIGSLPGHIVLGRVVPGGDIPAQGVLFARTVIKMMTLFVTMPGLGLAVLAGLGLWTLAPRPRAGWMKAHLLIGLLVLANGAVVLTPQVLSLAGQAQALVDDRFDALVWQRAKTAEDVAGTINLLAALASMAIACARPRRRVDPLPGRP